MLESVGEFEDARHKVMEIDRKSTLLRGTPGSFDVTVEATVSVDHIYSEALAKLVVRETTLQEKEVASERECSPRGQ